VNVIPKPRPADLARHRTFVTSPSLWPSWPFLPVIRRGGGCEELGVLFDARGALDLTGYSATVFRTNLFELPARLTDLLDGPKDVFDSSEELLLAGWRVD
jgi:hypothetical protein